MKVRYALVAALILVLVGVAGLSETKTYPEQIWEGQSVVLSGSLDFNSESNIHKAAYDSGTGWVRCNDVLVINVYFNHDVTLQLTATSFDGSSKTLPTEYGLVTVGLEETACL